MVPFRSREILEAWIEEFSALGHRTSTTLSVIAQDGSEGGHTGLVAFTFDHIPVSVYIQPASGGGVRWTATVEAREDAAELSAVDLADLAAELVSASALVAFLEAKSAAAPGGDGRQTPAG